MLSNSARKMVQRAAAGVAVGLVVLSLSCKGGDGPQVPTTFAATGGSSVTMNGTVAVSAPVAPQVQILDAKGKGIKGLRVKWRVGAASGSVINDSSTTDLNGVALSGGWTLGVAAGLQTLTATADGVSPITFTAQVAAGPVANLVRVSPDPQQASVNTNVPNAPSARAQDVFANPVSGVAVTFTATSGGSIEGAQQTTDINGIATAQSWKLGTTSGQQIAQATATGATQAAFSANALPGAPTALVKVTGDGQTGVPGLTLSIAPGVRVLDAFNNSVGGIPVTFTPGPNSGSVTGGTVQSDPATGTAFVGSWILGAAPTQTLVATSSAIAGVSQTFSANSIASSFNLEVRFIGEGGTEAVRNAFVQAAVKWRRMIVGHVHSVPVNLAAGSCLSWVPAVSETINDVVIFARIGAIDGVGSILAQAGPCIYNTVNFLPVFGIMEFDEADIAGTIANGTFNDVVLHEMGHVLGVGTLWNLGRNLLTGAGTTTPFFTGAAGRSNFAVMNTVTFSGSAVPVEGLPAPVGTRDGHWRESVLGRELMQGYAKVGGMPLSRLTVGSLQDMGYVVNIGQADPFTITSPILQGFPASGITTHVLLDDQLPGSMIGVDAQGRVVTSTPRRRP